MSDVHQLTSHPRDAEQHWKWKASLRAIICIIDLVAIGCTAWIIANTDSSDPIRDYYGYFGWQGAFIGALVALCVSFIWCTLCILLPFHLKPTRPIHPGFAVGFDLILWLGFIIVGLISTFGVLNTFAYGADPSYLPDPTWHVNYRGNYYLPSTTTNNNSNSNTWVYIVTHDSTGEISYYNTTLKEYVYPHGHASNVTRVCTPEFTSCLEQDNFVNELWKQKPTREGVVIVSTAVQWLDVLLHFVLFVWACVDTKRRNALKKAAKKHAADKVMLTDLERRRLLLPQNQTSGFDEIENPQVSAEAFVATRLPPPAYSQGDSVVSGKA